jgi:hypothetical protein
MRMRRSLRVALSALVAALALGPGASAVSGPYLQIAPTMPREGSKLSIFGRGFCARTSCTKVVLTVDGRWVAKPFRPGASGRFVKTITVRQSRGPHTLVASQVQTNGKRARAKLGFIVLGNETE